MTPTVTVQEHLEAGVRAQLNDAMKATIIANMIEEYSNSRRIVITFTTGWAIDRDGSLGDTCILVSVCDPDAAYRDETFVYNP